MSASEAAPTVPLPGATQELTDRPTLLPEPALLAAFADTLLPGDDLFPAASAVGAHGLLAERLRQRLGGEGIDRCAAALLEASGGDRFADLRTEQRSDAVRRLETSDPELFELLRSILYYAYYQNPVVVRAIRALGWTYNDAPQPLGYPLAPFDPTPDANLPAAPRGSYKPTATIVRVALPVAAAPAKTSAGRRDLSEDTR